MASQSVERLARDLAFFYSHSGVTFPHPDSRGFEYVGDSLTDESFEETLEPATR